LPKVAQGLVAQGRAETKDGNFFNSDTWKKISPVLLTVGAQLLENSSTYSRVPRGPFAGVGPAAIKGVQLGQQQELQKSQLDLLKEKVSQSKAARERRKAWQEHVKTLDPNDPMRKYGAFMSPEKVAEKMLALRTKRPAEGMIPGETPGTWKYDPQYVRFKLSQAAMGASKTYNKFPGEFEAQRGYFADLTRQAAALRKAGKTEEAQRVQAMADRVERKLTGGDELPADYRKALAAAPQAAKAIKNVVTKLEDPDFKLYSVKGWRDIGQEMNTLMLQFATLFGRGANFTATEQAMVAGMAGGDPRSFGSFLEYMAEGNRESFIARWRAAYQNLQAYTKQIQQTRATGRVTIPNLDGGRVKDSDIEVR